MQNTADREAFVDSMIESIKHMELALKPTGSIVIGLPTDQNLYKIIEKINTETNLIYGPAFFWDYSKSFFVKEVSGVESNIFLNLHKGQQQTNTDYKIDSYTLVHPWEVSEELLSKSNIAFVYGSAPDIVFERIIQRYSKPGDTVADLFGGTGLVLKIAKSLDREIVYNDISEQQLKLAKLLIDNEGEENPMDLKRSEVIDLMTKSIHDMNIRLLQQNNTPHQQIESYVKDSTPELNGVNGMLFDLLVKHGVIR
jgi:hypothetical protein